ncbi:hypothetical protein [Streptomyces sp. NBC_01268]|uniref:hypothetical protein n=1 Tax=Streptomyces sp. NBC_01268 TaxID=2903806 RepID=UPI002E323364|nr:hypothetical protein [Streptomyces sp. NBC_01268]
MSTTQGTHVYVLTLQGERGQVCTLSGTHTPARGWTRFDVLTQLRKDACRQHPYQGLESAIVLFFSLDPNTL